MYKLVLRSNNKSCAPLRELRFDKKVLYRMGSTTPEEEILKNHKHKFFNLVINTIEGCKISSDKRLMKKCFKENNIKTSEYFAPFTDDKIVDMFKIQQDIIIIKDLFEKWNNKMIIKKYNSSKGNNIYYIDTKEKLEEFLKEQKYHLFDFVFEKYYTYSKEYRLHVTKNGCFYTCRKMLKNDAEVRWHRHENNSVWILEDNPLFDKPKSWDKIVEECKKVLKVMKLDIAAFDVKVQTNDKKDPDFIILESNTAPALGEIGIEKYKKELSCLVQKY